MTKGCEWTAKRKKRRNWRKKREKRKKKWNELKKKKNEDDLDAYLTRFERACTAFDVRPEFWSTQLARLLQGRSLEVLSVFD